MEWALVPLMGFTLSPILMLRLHRVLQTVLYVFYSRRYVLLYGTSPLKFPKSTCYHHPDNQNQQLEKFLFWHIYAKCRPHFTRENKNKCLRLQSSRVRRKRLESSLLGETVRG